MVGKGILGNTEGMSGLWRVGNKEGLTGEEIFRNTQGMTGGGGGGFENTEKISQF